MGRAAHVALALAAAPLFAAFVWQSSIATVGDDSVSYLAMARWFAGSADAFLAPWLAWHSHFPPLFPMVLAATGGANDLVVAHLAVAFFAIVSVVLLARVAALRLGSDWGGFWVAAAFLTLPTAWISVKGILAESLYLALSLGVILAHQKLLARGVPRARAYLLFGVLLALAYSTRSAGVALVAAFVVHEAIRAASTRRLRPAAWLALVPVAAFAVAWVVARPGGHAYGATIASLATAWRDYPVKALELAAETFPGGWIASFVAEGDVSPAVRITLYALGLVALAGSVRAALRNRLDGWYVLLMAGLVFIWVFGAENMRRLLYPIVPLALLHAAEMVVCGVRRLGLARPRFAIALACAMAPVLWAPAILLVAGKARDHTPLIEGSRYSAAEITDYYRVINLAHARALAAKHAATLGGLEALRTATPPDARVMWMRPEYVALLGGREAVPSYYDWDARTLASRIREARVDYLVVAAMSKLDLAHRTGDPATALGHAAPYSRAVLRIHSPHTGQDEFILLAIERAALDAYLAAAPPS
ncbi:MAG: hypothetical protein H7Y14_01255 [Burkholderiales bacterium]|nr:hypothetical protein [Burkholderiales bacterium]